MNHELSNTINNSVHLTTATDPTSHQAVLQANDDVFNSTIVGNNGATGPVEATVNMGPVQLPQRKGRVPQYSRHKLAELQEKYDEPEQWQVFRQLKDVVVSPEYLNPPFLIKILRVVSVLLPPSLTSVDIASHNPHWFWPSTQPFEPLHHGST